MATYSQMLKEVQAMTKRAQAKLAEISGEDPDNMPGAENDKDVTLPKEDPEVNDGSMGPESTRSTEGKGDDRPITAGDLFESDESIVNPEEKPLETADANAKEASAQKTLVNDILSLIHGQQTAQTKQAAQTKQTAQTKQAAAPAVEQKKEKKVESKPDTKSAGAPELNLELTTDILAKLACAMLAEKEGADLAEKVMAKQAGAKQAEDVFNFISGQEKAAEEYAAGQRAAQEYVAGQRAAAQYVRIKQAQDLGANEADAAIAAMAAQEPEAAPEAPAAEDVPPDVAAAADGADDGEMLPEDAVAQVLMSQLESGALTEEDLAEIVEELAAEEPEAAEELGLDVGVGDEAAEGGDEATVDPSAEPSGEEPEAEPEADDGEKEASAKKASAKKASAKKVAAKKVSKKPVSKQASLIYKRASMMSKIAAASKLLVAHIGK